MTQKIARIQVGNSDVAKLQVINISFSCTGKAVEILDGWDEENEDVNAPSTLKDVAIIMESMVGQGVTWQLANELSNRLKLANGKLISDTLFDIFGEYCELSDQEAFDRYENSPKFCGDTP